MHISFQRCGSLSFSAHLKMLTLPLLCLSIMCGSLFVAEAAADSSGSPSLTDASGNSWTLTPQSTLQINGSTAGYTNAVVQIVNINGTIYQENASGGWWSWNGSTWIATSAPAVTAGTPSIQGSAVTGALLDSAGNSWSLTPQNRLQINGAPAGYTNAVVQVVNVNGTIYQENASGGWWAWNGSAWNTASAPAVTAGTPSIQGSAVTGALLDSAGNSWSLTPQNTLQINGAPAGYTNAVVQVVNINGTIYQENASGGWWYWNGSAWIATSAPAVTAATPSIQSSTPALGGSTGSAGTTGSSGAATATGTGGVTTGTTSTSTPAISNTPATAANDCNAAASSSGTTAPSASSLTDCQGNVWNLSGGQPQINQNPAGSITNATQLLEYNGYLYVQDSNKNWWLWNTAGTGFVQMPGDPRTGGAVASNTAANGVCGSANAQILSSIPTTNLCATGASASVVSGNGPWSWECTGSDGGNLASCYARSPGLTAGFSVANGQIIDPSGNVFIARGINVSDSQMGSVSTDATGAPLTTLFPGINFVRLNVYSYNDPSYYQTFITQLTALGIVVELEDHTSSDGQNRGGSTGVVFTGSLLTSELNWFTSVAAAYAGNPYVWFGTDNEPPESPSAAALSTWQQQTYQAIRNAGNNSIILVEMNCWTNPITCGAGYTASVYTGMTHIVWDSHFYGWLANYATDQTVVNQAIAADMAASQQFTSADGTVPVIMGEYGPSTSGGSADADGNQVISGVQGSGFGSAAWHWGTIDCCNNLNNGNTLTSFGQQVANFTSSGR